MPLNPCLVCQLLCGKCAIIGVGYFRMAVSEMRKIFTGPTYKLLLSFTFISDVYMSIFQTKLNLLSTDLRRDFKTPRE